MKTIIVYYSLDGNTKRAAKELAEKIGADTCEILPVKPLPSKGKPSFGTIMKGGGQVTFGICPKHALTDKITAAFTLSGSGDDTRCVRQLRKLLPQLGQTVSLADGRSPLSQENSTRLAKFAAMTAE